MVEQIHLENVALSVSQLVEKIQTRLTGLNPVIVQGEIAGLTRSGLGHHYFELKDDRSKIRCVIFKGAVRALPELKNGLQVKIGSRASIYGPQGSLQLKVDRIELLGDGLAQMRFEKLKKKLDAEGLFDPARKKALPAYPERIVLITSENAAAYHDVCKTLQLTWPILHVKFMPASVQGRESVREIVNALRYTCRREITENYELILLVRGGGSADDLWSFNEEAVVRACAALTLPLVTGIGHEIDFTLCDFVADHRGATPTAAAAAISPGRDWLTKHIREHISLGARAVTGGWDEHAGALELARQGLRGYSPASEIERLRQNVDLWQTQAAQATQAALWRMRERSQALKAQVVHFHPALETNRRLERVRALAVQARTALEGQIRSGLERLRMPRLGLAGLHPGRLLDRSQSQLGVQLLHMKALHPRHRHQQLLERHALLRVSLTRCTSIMRLMQERLAQRLDALHKQLEHPDKILDRGYALITDNLGRIIRRREDALSSKVLNIRVSDGQFRARPLTDTATKTGVGAQTDAQTQTPETDKDG
ncbi:MAG: exodeoxyribonuclease VII large subunit [Gammaproteobacteria bacterium]|nr:exodeoxyribonuclease VII large subunit [Gammaproteobacteria bacterium]